MTSHTLLQRQIRRSFGVDSIAAMVQTVAHGAAEPAARADLAARLQRLGEMVAASYSQFDRDLDLRSRSLALSSQELTHANQRLRDEASQQKRVLDTLRASTRELLSDLALPQADAAQDDLLGLATLLRDLVQQRQDAHRELLQAKNAADVASTAKTRFLANMSHELRTPLNAVIGAAQLLATDSGDAGSRGRLVDAIQRSGMGLLGVIENILDLSRIEAGELSLAHEDFHLLDCVEAALATASVAARAKGLTMACVIDPGLPAWRNGDAIRLRQVLLNLLGNAVKFTAAGEVVLRLQPAPGSAPGAGALQLSVSDTGVGIAEAALPHIFKAFHQGEDGANRRFGGSGLGLAIAHQLVQAQGGSIQVHSQPGHGTRFDISLTLPLASSEPPAPQPMGVPIAYYEPHEASAQGLAAQLQRLGCPAQRVHSSAALRQWLADNPAPAPVPWLLVACDDGQAWGLLEESADDLDPEHVIGMTGAEAADIDLARETMHLPRNIIKPVLRSALVSRLGVLRTARAAAPMHTSQRAAAPMHTRLRAAGPVDTPMCAAADVMAPEVAPAMAPEPATAIKHILVVEDDALNQSIVCQMLHHAGYHCSAASDGAQALAMLREQAFDLALMDWQMPDMDGLEVTRRIRQGRAGSSAARMPIVALTANAYAEDRSACLAAGMNDFLTKPVLVDRLLTTIERWTGQRGNWHGTPGNIDAPPSATGMRDETEAYDPSVLAALPMVADGSDPGYADELLKMFTQSARTTLDRLDADLAMRDMNAVQRRAHILKSSAAQVGALALSAEAARIESVLRRGGTVEVGVGAHLRQRLGQFEQALATLSARRAGASAAANKGARHADVT